MSTIFPFPKSEKGIKLPNNTKEYSGQVVAKFRVDQISDQGQIRLNAVTDETNQQWAEATPYGQLEMKIDNPSALSAFTQGKEMILTFQDAQQWEQQHSGS